ncbi:YhgE/Pip family protein [Mycetocola zhujimingii]|uniref:ABC-2 type transporter transmembrane domain-containing protein n=1 Tax=Mycetocola zhujimingii TaxID=2079792 RepID=A0A2U1TAY9_9MICO|nr:YhgE/Pip family protein [Mycetocola zhujimingii]PWC06062.1 hypothetical protein DF223_13615 [Mycetocola zhujimingii]
MKIPQMILAELRRLVSTPMQALALMALLIVPILYGGLYLWANQDPYGRLSEIPVALVVEDTGAEINGTERNLGTEVADALVKEKTFDLSQVEADAATSGLENGDYDFVIEIPAGFSEAVASINSSDPKKAELILRTDDANNYLATTIGNQAIEKIQTEVTAKVVAEAGLTLLNALSTIRSQLSEAVSGAGQLADGLATAQSGAGELVSGSTELATGLETLRSGSATLATGAAEVADGTQEIDDIARRVGTAANDVVAALPQVRTDISQVLAAEGLDQATIDAVLARLQPIGTGLTRVDQRVQTAVSQINRLNSGAQEVASGSAELAAGAATAANGAVTLRDGTATLNSGLAELTNGANELKTGLENGVAQLPDDTEDTRQAQASTLGTPVSIDTKAIAPAQNYGAGLAPFFAALAAWIGIYALFLIVKPISRRAVTALHSPFRVTLAGWATPAMLGALQMLGLFGVLSLALRFQFANPLATFGVLVAASLTYTAIILALNVWLSAVGQFIGLVMMVLQLVTAGGTFPWQTLPGPLAFIHHIFPMSYVVDALRQLMYGGDIGRVGADLSVLALWFSIGIVATVIGVTRQTHHRTLTDLQPSILQ